MKIKNVKIGIRTRRQALDEAAEVMEKLSRGETVKRRTGVYFENLDAMRGAFTDKRIEVLHVVKEEKPESVYALAKRLGRDITNVIDDLNYLNRLGLVELKKGGKRRKTVPTVGYGKIRLEIAI